MRESLPPGVEVRAVYDQAGLIAKAVANVRDAVLVGGLLTLVVVAAFLRSWRATLAAAAALPATLLMTFAVMRLAGASLNLMSLGGLAVAIGLVVDDAVVVVEAVYRRVAGEKMEPWHASAEALREVAWPVVNSTLTTVVVFAPLSLLSGVSGQFFAALALTLCAAVLLSLLVALGLTPLLCGRLMRSEESPSHGPRAPRVEVLVSRVQARPGRTLALAGVGALLLAMLGWGVGTGFLPELDEGAFVVDYFTPTGTSLAEADRLAGEVEAVLRSAPEVEVLSRRLGAELGPPAATESSRGDITVTLSPAHSRPTEEIIAELRERMEKAVPGVRVEFVELLQDELSDLEGNPEPVEVMLLGSDVDVLRAYAPEVANQLEGIPGLVDLYNGVSGCTPETHVRVRPAAAGRLGLTAGQVATQVRTALLGGVVAQVPRAGRLLNVRLRLEDAARFDPQVLDRLRLHTAAGPPAPLTSVADVEFLCLPSELLSDNLRPLVPITGRLEGRDLGGVTSDVEARLAKLHPPSGVQVSMGGQRASQRESFQSLALVFALALGAVFAVLTFHFRSLVLPLLILGAVPLALAAGTAALRVFGVPLNVSSFMGLILLVGLVVKNGILLLDHAEAALEHGSPLGQAVVTAVSVRLRPILMTTLATLLGLLPLALGLGTGAELQRPLAVAVMGGLSFSTLAVLTALPAAYALVRGFDSDVHSGGREQR
jgi:multidrug efflux pump subunit AcrB